jgi:hypothetical protein
VKKEKEETNLIHRGGIRRGSHRKRKYSSKGKRDLAIYKG